VIVQLTSTVAGRRGGKLETKKSLAPPRLPNDTPPMPHEPRRSHDAVLQHRARRMRREPTDAERKLWQLLRDRRLGGFKFRRQAPIDHYVVDFFCEEASLAVELDGEQHGEPEAVVYDGRRTARLEELRIRVLRFTSRETVRDVYAVARTILRVLTEGK
jgi:very-short-patch-repair endonuclease